MTATIKNCFRKAGFVKKKKDSDQEQTGSWIDGWADPAMSYEDFLNVDEGIADIIADVLNKGKQGGVDIFSDENCESSVAEEVVPRHHSTSSRVFESKIDVSTS